MKKLFLSIVTVLVLLFIVSCVDKNSVFEVVFEDYDGTVLSVQEIKYKEKAIAPEIPNREGYTFLKWDTNFNSVKKNLVVKAIYELVNFREIISAMGTDIIIDFYGGTVDDLNHLVDLFVFYTQITSNFERNEVSVNSPYYNLENVYLINEKRGIEPVHVSDELFELIEYSLWLIDDTNGYFNPLIGNAINIWKEVIDRFNHTEIKEEVYLNTINELSELEKADVNKIVLDEEAKTVYLVDDTIMLNLGAVAKGYVTNLAINYLKEKGIKYYMVDSGKSNIGVGTHIEERPYKIGNKDPINKYENSRLGILEKLDTNIVTSGYDEQYVSYDGHFYHHILSPFDYLPRDHFLTVVLIGDDAGLLDAYSTAVYSMDLEEAIEFLEEKEIKYLLYLNETYKIITNLSNDEYKLSKKRK